MFLRGIQAIEIHEIKCQLSINTSSERIMTSLNLSIKYLESLEAIVFVRMKKRRLSLVINS